MIEKKNNKVEVASDQEILYLDEMLKSIDSDISVGMSYVRRTLGMSFKELERKVTGIKGDTLQRYMQQSYHSMRPIHAVAAFSWITMVPMTALYYGFKIKEFYRGMDDDAVEALVRSGRLPTSVINIYLNLICDKLTDESAREFLEFRQQVESEFGVLEDHGDLLPPTVLDMNDFAIDYYRSVAITLKRFREEHNISIDTMSRVLGLTRYQYGVLENPNKISHFSVSIGFRVKLGFKLNTHVYFTSEMKQFPEFHKLRQVQHVRDLLIVEAMRRIDEDTRKPMVSVLISLSKLFK
ncbi:helix-turn-helix transcriptional regulator [Vibrio spartinae]|uniref:Uncharacterized protein n=1 Tax=Vibrio spartinae TaxID=1918945 RepID=A0A1N6M9P6_9VIBR|nr:helix-turn-helix transcriptional regulator [Vibrio spartinae]SIO96086.1 hypothetical protein VSP9026_03846 [Vibrio spartinae]